jgi:hypothetical protein
MKIEVSSEKEVRNLFLGFLEGLGYKITNISVSLSSHQFISELQRLMYKISGREGFKNSTPEPNVKAYLSMLVKETINVALDKEFSFCNVCDNTFHGNIPIVGINEMTRFIITAEEKYYTFDYKIKSPSVESLVLINWISRMPRLSIQIAEDTINDNHMAMTVGMFLAASLYNTNGDVVSRNMTLDRGQDQ